MQTVVSIITVVGSSIVGIEATISNVANCLLAVALPLLHAYG